MARATLFLITSVMVVACAAAQVNSPPVGESLSRLRALGRPSPRLGDNREARGKVTAVNEGSITIRGQYRIGATNCKGVDNSGGDRYGEGVRNDATKPIVLHFPGWELDCDSYKFTREGMRVTLLTGEKVLVREADQPTLRFPAVTELLQAAPHPGLPFRNKHCHLLPEVMIGDLVELALIGKYGKEECVGIAIERRPGGRVPYSTHAREFFRERIDQCNAYQQYEENGVPIPDRFRRDLQRLEVDQMDALERAASVQTAPPPRPKHP